LWLFWFAPLVGAWLAGQAYRVVSGEAAAPAPAQVAKPAAIPA